MTNPWSPPELLQRIRLSGLRGRGGGWFPVARKWQAVLAEGGMPFVVVNGAEGEPGSIKDRFVMITRARDVLDGLELAARAVGATEAVVYLKGSFAAPAQALKSALHAAPPPSLDISIRLGEEGYIAGEETAILETLEGRRAWPRPKPPLPFAVGFQGRPTLVQNVETLARVPAAVAGAEAFSRAETTLVSLWGDVRKPGVYDIPLGTSLRAVIEGPGGGAPRGIGLVFPGGPSSVPLGPGELDAPLDPDALRKIGSSLGTASVLVLGAHACPLAVAASLSAFFARESCAQCPPCSVGTARLHEILACVEGGTARVSDLSALAEAAGFMSGHGYCAHGRTAAASVTGLLARFRGDVEAHLKTGGCPRPGGRSDPFASDSPERVLMEGLADGLGARP